MAAVIASRGRHKRRPVAEINVVPYIDVMLVLLVIFMITAPLVTQGVKVELPEASAEAIPQDGPPPIMVSVDAQGHYYVTVGETQHEMLSQEELIALVVAQLRETPKAPVVVNGDKRVSYDKVVQLMVWLQQAGVAQVGLMTDPSDSLRD